MAYTLEQACQAIENLQQQITDLTNRYSQEINRLTTIATATDAEHRRVHERLAKTQELMAQSPATGGKGEFRLVDPKTMPPDKLGTDKAPWEQWAEDVRACVENLNLPLSSHLKAVEGREMKLEAHEIESA